MKSNTVSPVLKGIFSTQTLALRRGNFRSKSSAVSGNGLVLILLHSEWPKLHRVLAILSEIELSTCLRQVVLILPLIGTCFRPGGGAMVLGKLPVPERPTIFITVGQGPTALTVGAGGGCFLDIFTVLYPFSPLFPSLWETARYRLKYCLKGPLNPKQPTNQPMLQTGLIVLTLYTEPLY